MIIASLVIAVGLFPVLFFQLQALHRIECKLDELKGGLPF